MEILYMLNELKYKTLLIQDHLEKHRLTRCFLDTQARRSMELYITSAVHSNFTIYFHILDKHF